LSGKYSRADLMQGESGAAIDQSTRKGVAIAHNYLTERNLVIADVVKEVAAEIGKTPSQVALAWTLVEDAVTSPIIGVRTVAQLEDNLDALRVQFTAAQRARLNEVSAVDPGFPHRFLVTENIRAS